MPLEILHRAAPSRNVPVTFTLERMDFAALPLHDARLEDIALDWAQAVCRLTVCPVSREPQVRELVFYDVFELVVPIEKPWGPSVYVNEVRVAADGQYEIEMQTGDTLRVRAARFTYGAKQ